MRLRGAAQAGLVMAAMVLGAREVQAEPPTWIGVHGVYYGEFEKWGVGVNGRQELGGSFTAGVDVDYVIRSNHSTWAGTIDLQYDKPLAKERVLGWVGVGGGVIRDDTQGDELPPEYDATAVLYVGAGLNGKPVMPFVEMRCMSHGNFHGVFYLGLRF
jgi:hypothetical protein